MSNPQILVIDNGSDKIKWGWAGQPDSLKIIGNYIAKAKADKRNYIGDVELIRNKTGVFFRRPFDRGYLINWDSEKEIWDFAFAGQVSPKDTHILLSEPLFNPDLVRTVQNEMIFEDYGFQAMYNTSAPVLSMWNGKYNNKPSLDFGNSPCQLVVDSSYSFTHIVPFFDNTKINYGVKRINVGGKTLTNNLKEVVSYRHWNVMEETWLMNLIKEKLCYVSLDFLNELKITQKRGAANTIQREYVLPDYITSQTGFIKENKPITTAESATNNTTSTTDNNNNNNNNAMEIDKSSADATTTSTTTTLTSSDTNTASNNSNNNTTNAPQKPKPEEQILKMNNERITIPEVLFNPSYTGIHQAGIPEAIVQSIESCHPDLHASLYKNILLTGGSTLFPNFRERVETEVRKLARSHFDVNVYLPEDPVSFAWHGGCHFPSQVDWKKYIVTKADYQEFGHNICKRRFFN